MTTDPVCKMQIEEKQAAAKTEYQGATYYFCSASCHHTFAAQPEKYVQPRAVPPAGGGQHHH
ncbi:MAG TPA: YHS domain-containing protein [Burkholderiales bacterium]|nr:YHS domain-containing protein [Burkholderiales bacterium]